MDDNSDNPDFESTTAVLRRRAPGLAWLPVALRENFNPQSLWFSVVGFVLAAFACISWIVVTEVAIHGLVSNAEKSEKSMAALAGQLETLHKIDTAMQVMGSKVDTIADEVDRQREWREHIERAAEEPPHVRKRH